MYCYYHDKVQAFNPDMVLIFIDSSDLKEKDPQDKAKSLHPYIKTRNNSIEIERTFANNIKYKIYDKGKALFSLSFGRLANRIYLNIEEKQSHSILFDKFYTFFASEEEQSKTSEIKEIPEPTEIVFKGV